MSPDGASLRGRRARNPHPPIIVNPRDSCAGVRVCGTRTTTRIAHARPPRAPRADASISPHTTAVWLMRHYSTATAQCEHCGYVCASGRANIGTPLPWHYPKSGVSANVRHTLPVMLTRRGEGEDNDAGAEGCEVVDDGGMPTYVYASAGGRHVWRSQVRLAMVRRLLATPLLDHPNIGAPLRELAMAMLGRR